MANMPNYIHLEKIENCCFLLLMFGWLMYNNILHLHTHNFLSVHSWLFHDKTCYIFGRKGAERWILYNVVNECYQKMLFFMVLCTWGRHIWDTGNSLLFKQNFDKRIFCTFSQNIYWQNVCYVQNFFHTTFHLRGELQCLFT